MTLFDAPVTPVSVAVRSLATAEIEAADAILNRHLPGHALAELVDGRSHLLGAFDGAQLVACLHWAVRDAMWCGRRVAIARTGPGATGSDHRGRGVMRGLLIAALEQMRMHGICLAGQETPIVAYHRGTGWEVATRVRRYRTETTVLRTLPVDPRSRCWRAGPGDAERLARLWHEENRKRPFSAQRSVDDWRYLLRQGNWWVASHDVGGLTGYARVADEEDADAPVLRADEMVACDVHSARTLLRAMAESTCAPTTEWWSPPDELSLFVFQDPRAVDASDEIDKLIRVVDARDVLDHLARSQPSGSVLRVAVLDELCDWNRAVFKVEPGRGAEQDEYGAPDVRLDVRALAALTVAAVKPSVLAAAGLLDAETPTAVHRLSELVPAGIPWYPDDL